MKNKNEWKPSKFVRKDGRLIASRDVKEVSLGSRLITDMVAKVYDENIKIFVKGRLLDLGCGKVPLYDAYKNYVDDVTCVDWGNTLHRNLYLDFELDLTHPLPFDDETFDTIIISDVLEHLAEPMAVWKEISRLLSKDGKILLNVPFYYWIHEQPHDYFRYTEFALRRFVEKSELNLLQIKAVGGVPEIISDVLSKSVLRLPRFGRYFCRVIEVLYHTFTRTKTGYKFSEATSTNFPFFYFVVAEKQ